MLAALIQNAFDGMVSQCRRYKNAARHSFHNVLNDQLALKLVDI